MLKRVSILSKDLYQINNDDFDVYNNQNQTKVNYLYDNRIIKLLVNNFEIQLIYVENGIYLINVSIKGKLYNFVLDTGATISGIIKKRAQEFDLDVINHLNIKSASGNEVSRKVYNIEELYIGGLYIKNQPLVELDENDFKLPFSKEMLIKFDGIIGYDILKNIDFSLNLVSNTITFSNYISTYYLNNLIKGDIPLLLDHGYLYGIDSGAHCCWVDDTYNEQLFKKYPRYGLQMGVLGIELNKHRILKLLKLNIGNKEIIVKNVRTGFTQINNNCRLSAILGNEIFKGKLIIFSHSCNSFIIEE